MQRDTWIMLGSIVGLAALLVPIMVALFASTNARIDGLRGDVNTQIGRLDSRIDGLQDDFTTQFGRLDSRIDGLRDDINAQIGSLRDDINAQIGSLRDDVNAQIGSLRDDVDVQNGSLRADMREDHAAIHTRLDSLQDGLADVGQRLARVEERLGMARADDADAGPQSEP